MNSRMGRQLPDVEADDGPLTRATAGLIEDLGAGRLDAGGYLDAMLALYRGTSPWDGFARFIEAASAGQADQVILRKDLGGRDFTLQMIYVHPGEVHPCHHHHNVISMQAVLSGRIHAREYERLRRPDDRHVVLRPAIEGLYAAGDAMRSSEFHRNAHWFAALEEPAVMLNLNVRGFEAETFDPADGRALGRRLLDPTRAAPGGDGVLAEELDPPDAYHRFGSTPLTAFPLPVPAAADRAAIRLRD
jgi:hypothetical protein